MTKFKQIIGRGTRIDEPHGKLYFTILDFRDASRLFADPAFDGEPAEVFEPGPDSPMVPPDDTSDTPSDVTPVPLAPSIPEDDHAHGRYYIHGHSWEGRTCSGFQGAGELYLLSRSQPCYDSRFPFSSIHYRQYDD